MQAWEGSEYQRASRKLTDRAGFVYEFLERVFRITKGAEKAEAEIRWVMGSGQKAQTLLVEREGRWIESRLTWYRATGRLGLTPGHGAGAPFDAAEALGVEQSEGNLARCLGCHRTSETVAGIQCARCHAGAERHAAIPDYRSTAKQWSAATQTAYCGQCHRTPDREFRSRTPEVEDPLSVRFATVGFTASLCYRAEGNFGCLSCHDAHSTKVRAEAKQVCAGCHVAKAPGRCARTPGECMNCHMPVVEPVANLRFRDHRIRVR